MTNDVYKVKLGKGMNMSYWYWIYTKPGLEEFVTIQFNQQTGIEVFNPKIRRKRYLRGRMTVAEEKLFPCYLFARFDLSRYYRMVKYTRGVRSLVGDRGGNPYSVDEIGRASCRERV